METRDATPFEARRGFFEARRGPWERRLLVAGTFFFLTATVLAYAEEPVQITPLRPDEEHDVIVIKECQLAFRFGKESSFPAPVEAYQAQASKSFFFGPDPAASFCLLENFSAVPTGGMAQRITVECFPVSELSEVSVLSFQEEFRKSFFLEEATVDAGEACAALGLDADSCYEAEAVRLFQAKAKPMKRPDGRLEDVPICFNIFVLKTGEFLYLFALEKSDPFEAGTSPFRISFEARIDKRGESTASIDFKTAQPESYAW